MLALGHSLHRLFLVGSAASIEPSGIARRIVFHVWRRYGLEQTILAWRLKADFCFFGGSDALRRCQFVQFPDSILYRETARRFAVLEKTSFANSDDVFFPDFVFAFATADDWLFLRTFDSQERAACLSI